MPLPIRRNNEVQIQDPLRELGELHERMSHLLQTSLTEARAGAWVPAVDIVENDEEFIIEAELPGVRREDVTVEVLAGELTIRGEFKERERKGILRRQTRRTGQFDYRVLLAGEVDDDNVEAQLQEGVLRVHVRKAERAKPRRIQITRGRTQ